MNFQGAAHDQVEFHTDSEMNERDEYHVGAMQDIDGALDTLMTEDEKTESLAEFASELIASVQSMEKRESRVAVESMLLREVNKYRERIADEFAEAETGIAA